MENKECVHCKKIKSIDYFYVIKGKIDYYCKYCRNGHSLKGQANNKNKCSLDDCSNPNYADKLCRMHYHRKKNNGETSREFPSLDKVYKYPGKGAYSLRDSRRHHLKKFYKISMEEYDEMAKNGCWICGTKNNGVRRLHVEHDHKCCPSKISCGKCVRGIVCNKCNILIGKYEKNEMRKENQNKEKVIQYLLNYEIRSRLL